MKARTAWTVYILLRLAFLAVPLAVLMLIGWPWWLALAIAALVSVSLSVIFLSKQRDAASQSIYEWRNRSRTADDVDEDEIVDASEQSDTALAADETAPRKTEDSGN